MVSKTLSKVHKFGRNGMHIYIPSHLRTDSQNPFKLGDTVVISVDGEKMIVEHAGGKS